MKMLQQHEGMVIVRLDKDLYMETAETFEADYGFPMPVLLSKYDERLYEPGKRHALSFENSVIDGGEMPWPEGDAILAALPTLMRNRAARLQVAIDAQEAERKQIVERKNEFDAEFAELQRQLDALPPLDQERNALVQAFNAKWRGVRIG